ncbi:hypothetical protein HOH67_03330 [Candidatus Peregrinibacteria bacterium]|jgi:hypothetical protein|nr:hypothetical protein [Candidatus Peregrinibacteria bacterium]
MNKYKILKRVKIDLAKHSKTGNTKHFKGGDELETPTELILGKYPKDSHGYYLFYMDSFGNEMTDTYHESSINAIKQAEFEFGIQQDEWNDVNE